MHFSNIIQGTNLGGMEQASLRLMLGLKEQGHTCEVLSLNPVGPLGKLLDSHGIAVSGLPYAGRGGWRSFPRMHRRVRALKDGPILMTGHNLLAMLALGRSTGHRRVLAMHSHHEGVKQDWEWRLIYRTAIMRFDAITFPSDFVRLEAERLCPAICRMAHTVPNPLDVQSITSKEEYDAARKLFGLNSDQFVVGNAGWLIDRKRFDIFLKVAQRVSKEIPTATFLIAGDGDQRHTLLGLADNLGISDRVKWLGWQSELSRFYRSLDVMLFNSDWDAMGLSALEAMSYGVPLVASVIHGGLREVVADKQHGLLIGSHDIEWLAKQVINFGRNRELAARVGIAGRQRVQDVSRNTVIARKMVSLLGLKR